MSILKDFKSKLPKIEKVDLKDYDEAYEKLVKIAKICVYERVFFEKEYLSDSTCFDSMYSTLNSILFVIRTLYGPTYCAKAKAEIDIAMDEVTQAIKELKEKVENETDICEAT